MKALGAEVVVEPGAGTKSGIPDADFAAAGATVHGRLPSRMPTSCSRCAGPARSELAGYKKGALVIAIMDPYGNEAALKAMADAGVTAFAMELMPRITRAQVDGRALEPGQSRGLSRRDRRARPNTAARCR